jgi:hypothetical protein
MVEQAASRRVISPASTTRKDDVMVSRGMMAGIGLIAVGLLSSGGNLLRGDDKKGHDQQAATFEHCAKACTDCLRECESCAHHCANLVASGEKDHLRTLGTCADCAEVCTAAAKVVSRHGPLARTTCESCAKACDICAAECQKHAQDEHMKQCAIACRDCAKACRDMIKHLAQDGNK